VATAEARLGADEPRTLMAHSLRERLSPRGSGRAVGVSLTGLLPVLVERCAPCPDDVPGRLPQRPTDVGRRRLEAAADELWRVVRQKADRQWSWMAMDAPSRPVLALPVGDRSRARAQELWAKMPLLSRAQATFHPEQDDAYRGVIPPDRHQALPQKARQPTPIERFNETLRQRVARRVRATRSCSKTLANPIGAIKCFICHSDLASVAAVPV
jgi:insertion element IS1 protein InsB